MMPAPLATTHWPRNLKDLGQNAFTRFGATGGAVCLLDLFLIWLLGKVLPPLLAVSGAYLLAVTVHFCLNKWWVFRNEQRDYTSQIGRYFLTVFLCWATTVSLVFVATALGQDNIFLAKLWAIPPTTLLGFVLMKRFVFPVRS